MRDPDEERREREREEEIRKRERERERERDAPGAPPASPAYDDLPGDPDVPWEDDDQ